MEKIILLLHCLGITPGYRGYRQLILALILLRQDEDLLCDTMDLYHKVAYFSNSSQTSIERNIRTLAERAWDVNPSLLQKVAGYPLDAKPTNTEFLSILLSYAQREGELPWTSDSITPIHN